MTADRQQLQSAPNWCLPLVALGILARLVIAFFSWGSNDATQFQEFGRQVSLHGICYLYHNDRMYNHPPALGVYTAWIYRLTHDDLNTPDLLEHPQPRKLGLTFPFVFKWIDIVCDAITCWLLWVILRPRFGPRIAAAAAILFAWSPASLLMTGHHCNTDPIYAMLSLLAVYLIEDRRRDFWGGAALAAAINVKLLPVLLVIPLILKYDDRRRAARFLLGLSVGVLPFLPIIWWEGPAFNRNVITYGSAITKWGITGILLETARQPRFSAVADALAMSYYKIGRGVVLLSILWLALRGRRDAKWDRFALTACTNCLFLILTPGWGQQYVVMCLPLMFTTGRLLPGAMYGLTSGLMMLFTYWPQWTGTWPFDSGSPVGTVYGADWDTMAWCALIVFVFTEVRARRSGVVASATTM